MLSMFPELIAIHYGATALQARLAAAREEARHDERGMTTETVIITAILALLAITAGAVITAKVMDKAGSIRTE